MPHPVANGPAPQARYFGPAKLRQWVELASLAALVGAGAALLCYRDAVAPGLQIGGWSVLALALAYLLRRGWLRLFGPVLFYDLVRHARRTRTYVARSVYLAILLLFIWGVLGGPFARGEFEDIDPSGQGNATIRQMAALTEGFFYTFLAAQFALTVVLTPAFVAPAIAEEKERKTLEFLLATDLDSREIVLGKLLSRLGHLALLLLAGLPVLSAVQFLGGVEPDLVYAGFGATALTALSLAGVGILASVYAHRSRDAIMVTYLVPGLYLALCMTGELFDALGGLPPGPLFRGGPSAGECLEVIHSGNPLHAIPRLFSGSKGTVVLMSVLPAYAAFHLLVAAGTVTLAVLRLRPVALREARGSERSARPSRVRQVGGPPVLWKELYFSGKGKVRWGGRVLVLLLVLLSFAPAGYILFEYSFGEWEGDRNDLASAFNVYVRVVGTSIACLVALAATLRASVSVRVERDKDTLDALLTSPLTTREILFGKWAGCLLALRWPALWLAVVYLFGLVTGGLSPLALPLLVAAVLVYSGTLAAVGLWFSVACRTTVRAIVGALSAAVLLGGGHWLLLWMCCAPLGSYADSDVVTEVVFKAQTAVTPPAVLGAVFAFPTDEVLFPGINSEWQVEMIAFAVFGTICWAALGAVVWAAANSRFRTLNNRGALLRPEGSRRRRPVTSAGSTVT
jgi:ABC-type transport system involved in multi-copper enzyme maturation permease subunit